MAEQSELERRHEVLNDWNIIASFLDWCDERNYTLCMQVKPTANNNWEHHIPINTTIPQLLAVYYNIDLVKAEQERNLLLSAWRQDHPSY